jgi:putative ABC transport system permease protein
LAYHVTVDAFVIGLGIFLLLIFAAITLGSQTWRAVFINPVDNLKND